ncbi:transposable element Tcb2 transposase [Trichonephila clavipes]|nr:transposable element Tcb2 transposase [Trichonephila clavipes]
MNSIIERRVIHQVKISPKISAPKIAASTSNTLGRSVSAETLHEGFWRRTTNLEPYSTTGTMTHQDKLGLGSNFIFQQDNDPQAYCVCCNEWLLYHCRNQLNTPPQSPDLNVIENMWSHLERAVQKHQITSKEQLKSVLPKEG